MASYSELQNQIEDLKRKAAVARKEELGSALREIKKQIAEFGLTAADLGLAPPVASKRAVKPPAKSSSAKSGPFSKKKRATAGVKVAPKYRSPAGELWTGRGRQPTWVVEALAAGRTMDDLLIAQPGESLVV